MTPTGPMGVFLGLFVPLKTKFLINSSQVCMIPRIYPTYQPENDTTIYIQKLEVFQTLDIVSYRFIATTLAIPIVSQSTLNKKRSTRTMHFTWLNKHGQSSKIPKTQNNLQLCRANPLNFTIHLKHQQNVRK